MQCLAPRSPLAFLADLPGRTLHWPDFLRLAEEHRVVPLVAACFETLDYELIPLAIRDKLRELQHAQIISGLRLTAEMFRVLERFNKARVEVLVTKGPALAVRCYGDAGMRQYGDLDLILRERDIRRATEIMVELAYEPRVPIAAINAKRAPGEYAFRKSGSGILVEFHTERTFRYHPRPLNIEEMFQRSSVVTIDRRKVPVLSLEDELVLICVHGAKHFWERLMWIADVAALISRQPLDLERAMEAAREVGAERILRLGLWLAMNVLGAEMPEQIAAEVRCDSVMKKMAMQIELRLRAGDTGMGIFERATFRVKMRGSLLPGLAYLLRLTLSPTEEDWTPEKEGTHPLFIDAISRPLRLAKKHARSSSK